MSEKEIEQAKEVQETVAGTGKLVAEAVAQLGGDLGNRVASFNPEDVANRIEGSILSSSAKLSDKERNEAVTGLGKDLDAMIKGDIPHLRERMKELGLSTAELDKVEKELSKKVEAAKPLEAAILKGDATALQKMLATMDPKQLEEMTELIQKHLNKNGMGVEVDYSDGKLIISKTHGDRAVAISKDKLDVISINQDGSYDFSRHFRHENASKELQGMSDDAIRNYLFPRFYGKFEHSIKPYPSEWQYKTMIEDSSNRIREKNLPQLNILDSAKGGDATTYRPNK